MTDVVTLKLLNKLHNTPIEWQDAITGWKFTATPDEVREAELLTNKKLFSEDCARLSYWLGRFDIEKGDLRRYSETAWYLDGLFEMGVNSLAFRYEYDDTGPDPFDGVFHIIPNCYPCDSWMDSEGFLHH